MTLYTSSRSVNALKEICLVFSRNCITRFELLNSKIKIINLNEAFTSRMMF